jgi:tRNA1(Val) A37 N6-methylase TrmN6
MRANCASLDLATGAASAPLALDQRTGAMDVGLNLSQEALRDTSGSGCYAGAG